MQTHLYMLTWCYCLVNLLAFGRHEAFTTRVKGHTSKSPFSNLTQVSFLVIFSHYRQLHRNNCSLFKHILNHKIGQFFLPFPYSFLSFYLFIYTIDGLC